jgi:hypothetical protein
MIRTMCDTIAVLADDESWVRGQVEACVRALEGDVDHVSVAELRALLLTERFRCSSASPTTAAQALQQLKATMVDFAGVIAEPDGVDRHLRRSDERACRFIIEACDVAGRCSATVRGLLDDTRDDERTACRPVA